MENPIKMDDLGVPLFLETPRANTFLGQISGQEKPTPCLLLAPYSASMQRLAGRAWRIHDTEHSLSKSGLLL